MQWWGEILGQTPIPLSIYDNSIGWVADYYFRPLQDHEVVELPRTVIRQVQREFAYEPWFIYVNAKYKLPGEVGRMRWTRIVLKEEELATD